MDWLKCSICFNTYNDLSLRPRSLICGHTFCENCLNNTIQNKTLTCPQCRKILEIHSVTDLPINYIVEGLLKSLKPSSYDVTEGAISRPIEKEIISDDKQDKYDSLKLILKQQQESLTPQKGLLKTSSGMCNEHSGNQLIFRCSSHKCWACEKCIGERGDHPQRNCSIIPFKEEIENRKQEHKRYLENEENSCDETFLEIEKHLSDLSKKREIHISLVDALLNLVTLHKNEDRILQSEMKSFKNIIENGKNIKEKLLDVKNSVLNAETLDESNAARDIVENNKSDARNWVENSYKEVDEGKVNLQKSTNLEIATKRSLEYREKMKEDLNTNSNQSEKNEPLKRSINLVDNDTEDSEKCELKFSKASYDEVCMPHNKSIEHRCLKCKRWICVNCLKFHTTLTGCSTINSSTAVQNMKEEQTEMVNGLLLDFEKNKNCLLSKIIKHSNEIQEINIKKKKFTEQTEIHQREMKKLQDVLEEGKQIKGNVVKCLDLLDSTSSPYAVMDKIDLLGEMKQELCSWSIMNLGSLTLPHDIHDMAKVLKEDKKVYVECLINDEKSYGELFISFGRIYFCKFMKQTIDDDCRVIPFDCLQKLLSSTPYLVSIWISLGNKTKGCIEVELDANLPRIKENFLSIVTGQFGKSLSGIQLMYRSSNALWNGFLPFTDIKVRPDNGPSNAKRGDLVGNYANGYLQQLFFHVGDTSWTEKLKVFGKIVHGMGFLQECYDSNKSVVITDCGLYLLQD